MIHLYPNIYKYMIVHAFHSPSIKKSYFISPIAIDIYDLKIIANFKNPINKITIIRKDLRLNSYLKKIYYYMPMMNQDEKNNKKNFYNQSKRIKFAG